MIEFGSIWFTTCMDLGLGDTLREAGKATFLAVPFVKLEKAPFSVAQIQESVQTVSQLSGGPDMSTQEGQPFRLRAVAKLGRLSFDLAAGLPDELADKGGGEFGVDHAITPPLVVCAP